MAYPPSTPIHGTLTNDSPANSGGSGGEHNDYHNDAAAAITDIVAELGTDPKGTDADVTARLTRLETSLFGHRPTDYGLIAWNQHPALWALNSTSLADGTLYLMALWVPAGTINAVLVRVNGAATSLTTGKVAIYSDAGVLLGSSGDIKTQLESAGQPELALSSGVAIGSPRLIRVGIYTDGGTPPGLGRSGSNGAINGSLAAADAMWATGDTGLTTTLPDPHGSLSLSNTAFGIAVL